MHLKQQNKIDTPELARAGLCLEPLAALTRDQHLALLDLRNAEPVRQNMYHDQIISADTHLRWVGRMTQSDTDHIFALTKAGAVLGQASLRDISWADRRSDWAFYLSDACRGQGVGQMLERSILGYVFQTLDLNKLNCEVLAFNEPVIAMHKRFGFQQEGVRRQHIWRHGQFHDVVLLGMTQADYVAQQQNHPRSEAR